MTESLFVKNMFGIKDKFDVDVLMKTEDEKVVIIKTWNGLYKKLKFNEKEKCYEVKAEIKGGEENEKNRRVQKMVEGNMLGFR